MLSEDQLFPDNFAKREILSLTVRCPNSDCGEKMELRHLEVRILVDTHSPFKSTEPAGTTGCFVLKRQQPALLNAVNEMCLTCYSPQSTHSLPSDCWSVLWRCWRIIRHTKVVIEVLAFACVHTTCVNLARRPRAPARRLSSPHCSHSSPANVLL